MDIRRSAFLLSLKPADLDWQLDSLSPSKIFYECFFCLEPDLVTQTATHGVSRSDDQVRIYIDISLSHYLESATGPTIT